MAIQVGSLVVEMSANVARLREDVTKATGIFGNGMSEMTKAAKSVQNSLNLIVGSQFIHSLDLLARRGAEAFGALKRTAIDAADELNKLSQKTGFSVESLSGLKYAAELSDVSLEGLAKGLKGLSTNMVEARAGSKEMAALFGRLDVSLDSSEHALLQLADRFSAMPDGFEKSALAVKLFGKEGLALIPFLNQGRDGIAEITQEAQRFGLIISTVAAQQAEAFNDNLTRLSANVQGLVQQLGTAMLPTLLSASESFLDAKTAAGGFDEQVRSIVSNRDEVEGYLESFATSAAFITDSLRLLKIVAVEVATPIERLGLNIYNLGQTASIWFGPGDLTTKRAAWATAVADAKAAFAALDSRIADNRADLNSATLGDRVTQFFDQHRRTVRAGNRKYLMNSIEDAKALQAALDAAYQPASAGRPSGLLDQPAAGRTRVADPSNSGDPYAAFSKKLRDEAAHYDKLLGDFAFKMQEDVTKINEVIAELGQAPEQVQRLKALAEIDREFEKATKSINENAKLDAVARNDALASLQALRDKARGKTSDALDQLKAKSDALNASWEYGAKNALRGYLAEVNNVAKATENLMTRAFKGMEDALVNFVKTGKLDFTNMADSIISDLIRIQVQQTITKPLAQAASSGLSSFVGSLFGGGKAVGGDVDASKWYVVGEKGPEIFAPGVSGSIIPNKAIGGGSSVSASPSIVIHQTIQISTGVAQTVRAEVMGMMPQIQEAAVLGVMDARRRGGSARLAFKG